MQNVLMRYRKPLSSKDIGVFQHRVRGYFQLHGRQMPWREPEANGSYDPYKILVSEVMLQQTRVSRVTPKYNEFLTQFSTPHELAKAKLSAVLKVWNGLGYNRRAKYLHVAAQHIVKQHKGQVPATLEELRNLPGIGPNTAGAILVYAYNLPVPFVETNIRTVCIHHFFPGQEVVADREISEMVSATLDTTNPRQWYYALMDYGTYLKSRFGNLSRASKHYVKQPAFAGSKRQLRGQVIKLLASQTASTVALRQNLNDARLTDVLDELVSEGFLIFRRGKYRLA